VQARSSRQTRASRCPAQVLPLSVTGNSIVVSLPADCVTEDALTAAGVSREAFCSPDRSFAFAGLLFNQASRPEGPQAPLEGRGRMGAAAL
jgi:hypothetical protein